jgi:hypothetical protein
VKEIKKPVHNIYYQKCTTPIIKTLNIILDEWEAAQHFMIKTQDYLWLQTGNNKYTCVFACGVNI